MPNPSKNSEGLYEGFANLTRNNVTYEIDFVYELDSEDGHWWACVYDAKVTDVHEEGGEWPIGQNLQEPKDLLTDDDYQRLNESAMSDWE